MLRTLRCVRAAALGLVALALSVETAAARGDDDRVRRLTARDAVLEPVQPTVTKETAPAQGCQVLLDTGTGDCAVVQTAHGPLVMTIESGPRIDDVLASRPWTIRVYRPSPTVADGWELALQSTAADGYPGVCFAQVTAEVADVTGDGNDELVIGYRSEGTGHILDYEIVGTADAGTPQVLAHDRLDRGTVVVKPGRLVTYTAVTRDSDGNCCPTWMRRDTVRFEDGAFRVQPGQRIPTERADIPAGVLG